MDSYVITSYSIHYTKLYDTRDAAIGVLMPPTTQLVVSLGAGAERLAVLALGPRLHDQAYGAPECDLANTLSFAAAIALKNALSYNFV